jgi:hypothetical protein
MPEESPLTKLFHWCARDPLSASTPRRGVCRQEIAERIVAAELTPASLAALHDLPIDVYWLESEVAAGTTHGTSSLALLACASASA